MTTATGEPRPWQAGLAWLAFLGPFFFATYGLANHAAAQRDAVPSVVFGWEHAIPFLPWTIVPYWLIDAFYGLSLVLCATRAQLRIHVIRLLFVQVAAVACFLAFPLRCTFERPPVEGIFGWMFGVLEGFDQPYNQMPSLHAALLVVLWPVYVRAMPAAWHALVHGIAILIGVSVLTTWQHHFIDLPTGLGLGCLALWLIREPGGQARWQFDRARDPQRRKLAACYVTGASLLCALAVAFGGAALVLLWPAATLMLVSIAYLFGDGKAYCKTRDGHMPAFAWALFAPYFIGARLNALAWTRRDRGMAEIAPGLRIGSLVRPRHAGDAQILVDVAGELPTPRGFDRRRIVPMLDLVVPTPHEIEAAALAIDSAKQGGPVLVACALGYSRSALACAAWLLHARIDAHVEAAIERIRRARPEIVLRPRHIDALRAWQARLATPSRDAP